jgi:hypothetical protein
VFACWLSLKTICALPVWALARHGTVNVILVCGDQHSPASSESRDASQPCINHPQNVCIFECLFVRFYSQNLFFTEMSLSCALCNDQEKRDEGDVRLAFDFTPEELLHSARDGRCDSCLVILAGLQQATTLGLSSFEDDVRRVNARCRGQRHGRCDTLSLEVYFLDERPRLELEYCSFDSCGGSCRFSAVG